MRRIALLAAFAALLAFPALAFARDGAHHGEEDHGTHGSAPAACRSERSQIGDDAFRKKWGTNPNKANAFGKCVSAGGPSETTSSAPPAGTNARPSLLELATGAITSFGASGCTGSSTGCVLVATGSLQGFPIAKGTWAASLTEDWTHATSNGAGGSCAPTKGTVVLADGANTITENVDGMFCEIGKTGPVVGHYFSGSATIAAGAGAYAKASGSAAVAFYQPSGSNAISGFEQGSFATG